MSAPVFFQLKETVGNMINLTNRKKSPMANHCAVEHQHGHHHKSPFESKKISYNSITKSHQTSFVKAFLPSKLQYHLFYPFPTHRALCHIPPQPPNFSSNTIIDLSCTRRLRGKGVALGMGEDQWIHVVLLSTNVGDSVPGAARWQLQNSTRK